MEEPNRFYKVRFVAGELAGREFLVKDSCTIMGRAQSADIRFGSEAIASEHVCLFPQSDGGLLLNVYGGNSVELNGVRLGENATKSLVVGDEVSLAQTQNFVVMADDFGRGISHEFESEDLGDATQDIPTSGETRAESSGNTRYASADEIEQLRKFDKAQIQRKRTVLLFGTVLALLIVAGAFYYNSNSTENPATWPGEISGQYNDEQTELEAVPDGYFMVYYPKVGLRSKKSDASNCEILTAIGKRCDIPFHLSFSVKTLENGFETTREKSFAAWEDNAGDFKFIGEPVEDFLRKDGAGYPYYRVCYTRVQNGFKWRGILNYLRYLDKEIVFLREVPESQYWRAERTLEDYECFVVAKSTDASYWEIPEKVSDADTTLLLETAAEQLRDNIVAMDWKQMDFVLRTLLYRAYKNNDKALIDTSQQLWKYFKTKKDIWFSKCCLAYNFYEEQGDTRKTREIVDECLRKFDSPQDYRHIRIIKGLWSEQ